MDIIHTMRYSHHHAHETITEKPTWPPRLPLLCMHAYIMKDIHHSTECHAFKESLHSSCLNLRKDDFHNHHHSSNNQSSIRYIYTQIANTSMQMYIYLYKCQISIVTPGSRNAYRVYGHLTRVKLS